jgi:hypothetical protein
MRDDARWIEKASVPVKSLAFALLLICASTQAASAAARCPLVRDIVCGLKSDGGRAQFVNPCVAQIKGARVLHKGECAAPGKEPAMCNMLYQPVCATDPASNAEKSYPNLCHAEVANAAVLHDGECAAPSAGSGTTH